ncbi:MAG TPA: helix-turn-helix transcriptional regulator [Gemmatimonadales bacterium]|jgi:transcriptional regulator with XRE-family HTH domain|nr:helix-turn-helix transcriptional regulator [Gemmatimonadales bacterium]
MDVPLLIRQRLATLGKEQRDLARAAQVTESYISQLLRRKKAPPAPGRTDIYARMDRFLRLPPGELAKLAAAQRREQLQKTLGDTPTPTPLLPDARALILDKCDPDKVDHVRAIFEKQPFGELERLVTQKLLDVVKRVVRDDLKDESRMRLVAKLAGRRYEVTRVQALEFLDTDIFHLSLRDCETFLRPLIEAWDIDLATFGLHATLNKRLSTHAAKRFVFVERSTDDVEGEEPGFKAFRDDPDMCDGATEEELTWLRGLAFEGRRPTRLFYYRALQLFRDPLHFSPGRR